MIRMSRTTVVMLLAVLMIGVLSNSAAALKLLPSDSNARALLGNHFWLISGGDQLNHKVRVEINGDGATTIRKPEQVTQLTDYMHTGLNTIKFIASENRLRQSPVNEDAQLELTIGPEFSREKEGPLSLQTFIQLKENLVRYILPVKHSSPSETSVELRFNLQPNPNPELERRFILYSTGVFSGHKLQVAINDVPVVDLIAPGCHFDLNPHLKKGKNKVTFSCERVEAYLFTAKQRTALEGSEFEVGIAEAGAYDPVEYAKPIQSMEKVLMRYAQPADTETTVGQEELTLIAY